MGIERLMENYTKNLILLSESSWDAENIGTDAIFDCWHHDCDGCLVNLHRIRE